MVYCNEVGAERSRTIMRVKGVNREERKLSDECDLTHTRNSPAVFFKNQLK